MNHNTQAVTKANVLTRNVHFKGECPRCINVVVRLSMFPESLISCHVHVWISIVHLWYVQLFKGNIPTSALDLWPLRPTLCLANEKNSYSSINEYSFNKLYNLKKTNVKAIHECFIDILRCCINRKEAVNYLFTVLDLLKEKKAHNAPVVSVWRKTDFPSRKSKKCLEMLSTAFKSRRLGAGQPIQRCGAAIHRYADHVDGTPARWSNMTGPKT